jgi:uncharacterized SAM-binding protein YcdF (DUF218 family)
MKPGPSSLFSRHINITSDVLQLAQLVWDYHHLNHALHKADCIFVLGSHDTRVAERGAELYLQGWAPLLIFSGGFGRLTKDEFPETEAALFARIGVQKGVPPEAILVEEKSTNTGENIRFSRQMLQDRNLHPRRFILVQKPYMERRTWATFQQQWPGNEVWVTSPQISFADYPIPGLTMEQVINIMVGDLQRIKLYAEKGFQVYQEIPEAVWQAYETLVALGFTSQLVKE